MGYKVLIGFNKGKNRRDYIGTKNYSSIKTASKAAMNYLNNPKVKRDLIKNRIKIAGSAIIRS